MPEIEPPTGLIQSTSEIAEIRAAASVLLERIQFMRQAGITFEGMRDLYEILGYDRIITNRQYRDRYARGGLAKRIVEAMPKATWRGGGTLSEDGDSEDQTPFEQEWVKEDKRLSIWSVFQRADILAGLSTYAVILIGAPGRLTDPLPQGAPGKILYLTPFCGGGGPMFGSNRSQQATIDSDCTIQQYDLNTESARFGLPEYYLLRRTSFAADFGPSIHWSRIIHIAEGCLDDEVFGQPTLENVWNLLDDLEKVTGGGAEAFWLRANQGLHINFDKDMKEPSTSQIEKLKENLELYRHGIDRMIRTRGTEVATLGSDVANFNQPADAILTQIAGAKSIPKRILTGSEMGELASSQDRDNWKDQINGRQTGYAGPAIVRRLADRMIKFGYISTPSGGPDAYEVKWPHIEVLTEDEKSKGAKAWADTKTADGDPIFTADEIRQHWYAMEPIDDPETAAYRYMGAKAWATVNKTQGATVFTEEEIRDKWYGYIPLTPEQKIPLTAPERVSATAPTPLIDENGKPVPHKMGPDGKPVLGQDGQPIIAAPPTIATDPVTKLPVEVDTRVGLPAHQTHGLSDEQKRTLIKQEKAKAEKQQRDVQLAKINAIQKAPTPEEAAARAKKDGSKLKTAQHMYSSTQVNLPPSIAAQIIEFGNSIPDEDLAAGGREDVPHVTVKYGLHSDTPDMVRVLLVNQPPVHLTLGGSNYFESDEYDVVYIEVDSPDLERLNALVSDELATTTTHASYQPHATVAYVRSGLGPKYAGVEALDGVETTLDKIVFSNGDDRTTVIPLRGVKAAEEELISVLQAAIQVNNTDVIDKILGMRHAEPLGHEFHGNQFTVGPVNVGDRVTHPAKLGLGLVKQHVSDRHVMVEWFGQPSSIERRDELIRSLEEVGHEFHGNQWTRGNASFKEILARSGSEYVPLNPDGRDTQQRFSDGHGHYTPERQELHDAIVAHFTQGITTVAHPTAMILGGGMASGKTTLVESEHLATGNTVDVNVDKIRPLIPELREAYASKPKDAIPIADYHEEASDISRQLMREATAQRMNMTLDGTGDTTLEKLGGKVAEMRSTGHSIVAEYVTVPVDVAISRAAERAKGPERRAVPETAMREVHRDVSRIFPEAIRQGLFDRARLWNTDVPRGQKPTLIASAEGKSVTVHDQKAWEEFLVKGYK